jgi:hypothetical protein
MNQSASKNSCSNLTSELRAGIEDNQNPTNLCRTNQWRENIVVIYSRLGMEWYSQGKNCIIHRILRQGLNSTVFRLSSEIGLWMFIASAPFNLWYGYASAPSEKLGTQFAFSTITLVHRCAGEISDWFLDFSKCFGNRYIDTLECTQSMTGPPRLQWRGRLRWTINKIVQQSSEHWKSDADHEMWGNHPSFHWIHRSWRISARLTQPYLRFIHLDSIQRQNIQKWW